MTKYIGRRIGVGFGKETTRGTKVSASLWVPHLTNDFEDKSEIAPQQAAYGVIAQETDGDVIRQWAEGAIEGPIMSQSFGIILLALLGSLSSAVNADVSGLVYDHTFTVDESNEQQSLTINTDDPVQDYQYPNAMMSEMSITYERGSLVNFASSWMAKQGETATNTKSYEVDESFFRPQDFELKLADNVAGLGGASVTNIRGMSITIAKNVVEEPLMGSIDPEDFNNTELVINGEITQVFEDEVLRGYSLGGTKKAMQIKLQNTGVTIGTAANPELVITLNQVQFKDYVRTKTLGEIVVATYGFTAQYKRADSKQIQILLTNLETSY